MGPLSVQSLLQPVVHLPAGGREAGQVQRPGHAAGLQRPPEDEDHRSGGAGRGNGHVLSKTWDGSRLDSGFCNTEICRSHSVSPGSNRDSMPNPIDYWIRLRFKESECAEQILILCCVPSGVLQGGDAALWFVGSSRHGGASPG